MMTAVGQIRELNGESFPPLRNLIGKPNKQKAEILSYLRNAEIIAAAPGIMKDVLTGESTGREELLYSDGKYVWKSDMIYYVEKYDMELPEELVTHITGK